MRLGSSICITFTVLLVWAHVLRPQENESPPTVTRAFIAGGDISTLQQIEECSGSFTECGEKRDLLYILKDHGVNCIRLRLWHTPQGGTNGLEKTLAMARRIEALGMKLLLDLHYSDTWADPGKQFKPAAWMGLPFETLKDSVFCYTRDVVAAFRRQGTPPAMIQIGNEITCGMLWDDGRVCGPFDTSKQWDRFTELLKAGIAGVQAGMRGIRTKTGSIRDGTVDVSTSTGVEHAPAGTVDTSAAGPLEAPEIVIHADSGGNRAVCIRFYDNLLARGVGFDIVGLSFYPWWHGTFDDLEDNLFALARRYGKGILVVETAYPWTLGWNDDTHNIVGLPSHVLEGYPASVEGQKRFLTDLAAVIKRTPGGRGLGFVYWEPAAIAVPGAGSAWENMTLFDFEGELLRSIESFHEDPRINQKE
ncbi:MAG: glycosyl hydrolase 53 family protein [bacterium]|nr:MAG: glycosyl hydrolase 53 family protein [bacterium]